MFASVLSAPSLQGKSRSLVSMCLMSVLSLSASAALSQTSLPPSVEAALTKAGIPGSAISVMVLPAESNTPTLAIGATTPMNPASTMKLLTTLIALEELGPTFRWKTQFLSDATLKKDTLNGDLYLRGGGAPDISWDKISLMLRGLRNQGIRKINGDIVLDRTYFSPVRPDLGTLPFDDTPNTYYNVIPDALMVNSNILTFDIDTNGGSIKVQTTPPMARLQIKNELNVDDRSCSEWDSKSHPPVIETNSKHQTTITLSGHVPPRCKLSMSLNILDRNLYIEHLIRQLWQEMDGIWSGNAKEGKTPLSASVLFERQSDTLADIIKPINKRSDNSMARSVYLSLGAESSDAKNYLTSAQAAEARIRSWLSKRGINPDNLILDNGSGLSRTERISALQMAQLLKIGTTSNWYAEFATSLPIVAIDGTMRKRLKDTPLEGRARIKTGTLQDATAIAGYVRDVQNKTWIVVAMVNHSDAGKARPALDELIYWVATSQINQANQTNLTPPTTP
ncbi:D-alanyl-D-alanine carboxypeptidase/D-alanyl-D-alanine endopeptidase [Undibacterium sp. RuTC16W]|uniref:D-alanyl-D-alanine carboxypeptidase/D-alanyl-D-alanine endopeptidase n=1 Tax=Undibacterium sp. RuTC16W TaxID=3413048 RepID=UPI003BF213E4